MDSDGALFIHNNKDVSRFASLQEVGTKLAKSLFVYIVYKLKAQSENQNMITLSVHIFVCNF